MLCGFFCGCLVFSELHAQMVSTSTVSVTATVAGAAPPPPPPSSGGGGGGGGGGGSTPRGNNQVIFSGRAYPGSAIVLSRGTTIVAETPAGPDAKFEIRLAGLASGTYNFSIWTRDKNGYKSITNTYTVRITEGVTTVVSGIFIPPTISVDKKEVEQGELLTILGQSAPSADISIRVNSTNELLKHVVSDESGIWFYKLDTLELEKGDHTAGARAAVENDISDLSELVSFKVGNETVAAGLPKAALRGDVNHDGRVNLLDFSIVAFWYQRQVPPDDADVNQDGRVDLVDFSIMAYYWTG